MPQEFPKVGKMVATRSYAMCGTVSVGVTIGLVVNVDCLAFTKKYRYVIVQSLDTHAEHLCIGEVAVYADGQHSLPLTTRHRASTGMYSLTFRVPVTTPPQYGRNGTAHVAGASILSPARGVNSQCIIPEIH